MAGSKGGKQSKSKRKSKAKKSDAINRKAERFNSELELAQSSNNNFDGTKKDKNPQSNTDYDMSSSLTMHTEDEMVPLLYKKLIDSYNEVKDWLLKSGYSARDIERAFLKYGYVNGPSCPLNNILINSVAFLENKVKPIRDGFDTLDELYEIMVEALIHFGTQSLPNIPKADAMWRLYVRDWGAVPSTSTLRLQSCDQNTNDKLIHDAITPDLSSSMERAPSENKDSSLKKTRILERINHPEMISLLERNVPMIAESIQLEIGAPVEPSEGYDTVGHDFLISTTSCSNEECLNKLLECNSADPEMVDLVKSIRDLHDMVEDRKKWAHQKVIELAKNLSKVSLELKLLRMEMGKKHIGNKEETVEKSSMQKLVEMEQALRDVRLEAESAAATVRKLEKANAGIRADIEASKLIASESEGDLKSVLKRERRWLKRLNEFGKQRSHLEAQSNVETQRVLQLREELLQTEKEAEEAESKWRHEIKEKEQMFARLYEETRMVAIHKTNSRSSLSKLRQKLEIDSQVAKDERLRLEDEMSHLQLSHQMENVAVDDDDSLYNSREAISFTESSQETFSHRDCMICSQNEVSVVFLPCAHQVVCRRCHEDNGKFIGGRCPYCQVEIGQSIMVYGPRS